MIAKILMLLEDDTKKGSELLGFKYDGSDQGLHW